ncbi:MAG: hypothetical protein ACOCRK_06755 [bacterium]
MKSNSLERKIKLKSGFFKLEPFTMIINYNELILRQYQVKNPKEFRIKITDIKTISIYNQLPLEIEIITENESFIANFIAEDDKSEILAFIYLIFGNRFNYY